MDDEYFTNRNAGPLDADHSVHNLLPINPDPLHIRDKHQRNKQHKDPKKKDESAQHFKELAEAAERSHEFLVAHNSPYRFCVYQENGEVYIDIVTLDDSQNIKSVIHKSITHEDFYRYLKNIELGEGLFIDTQT